MTVVLLAAMKEQQTVIDKMAAQIQQALSLLKIECITLRVAREINRGRSAVTNEV
jgi:hypothetical protein